MGTETLLMTEWTNQQPISDPSIVRYGWRQTKMEGDVSKLAAGLAIGLGGMGPGIAIGIGASAAFSAIGRNPDAENAVRGAMIIGLGLAEAVAIYAFVVALVLALVV